MILTTAERCKKRRKERKFWKENSKSRVREEELLTAPVTFPPPAFLVFPRAIPWYTHSTQHFCQHHQQEQGHPPAGHTHLWSLHLSYRRESRAMWNSVPHSVISLTAVWCDPKEQHFLLGFPWSVSAGSRHWSPRVGHTFAAHPSSSSSFWEIGMILMRASHMDCNSSIGRKQRKPGFLELKYWSFTRLCTIPPSMLLEKRGIYCSPGHSIKLNSHIQT